VTGGSVTHARAHGTEARVQALRAADAVSFAQAATTVYRSAL
jgi:hypothetical protein